MLSLPNVFFGPVTQACASMSSAYYCHTGQMLSLSKVRCAMVNLWPMAVHKLRIVL